ncbi:unnamed protein product [Clavelina lepadiformis]|uniref:NAD(+) diphosphatase n=1 Tax=Clavelina lepadiformis TaxID=159417 RepID=A0ABP0GRY5_CLALP
MNNLDDDGSDIHATTAETIFKAAGEGNLKQLEDAFAILPSLSKDIPDSRGWTPLMLAARNGHLDVIELLLKNGADPLAMNKNGQTATDVASFWNQNSALNAVRGFLRAKKSPELEFVNYFSHGVVDRQAYKRSDKGHIESVMKSEKSRFVVFGELRLLCAKALPPAKGSRVLYFTWHEMEKVLSLNEEDMERDIIFLGVGDVNKGTLLRETAGTTDDSFAYFAVNFKQVPTQEQFPITHREGEFVGRGYNSGITALQKEESGLVAQARAVLAWHDKYIYCPTCGSKTVMVDSGYKRQCVSSDCPSLNGAHNTCFPRTDPVVIVLVTSKDGNKCLLGRQKRFPPQVYSCLAGFMEPGETIEDAARREVMEEAGVKVGKLEYHSSQPWPFPSNIMIGLIGHAVCDDITVDKVELEDAQWFERAEVAKAVAEGFTRAEGLKVPTPNAIAYQLIKAWLTMTSNL